MPRKKNPTVTKQSENSSEQLSPVQRGTSEAEGVKVPPIKILTFTPVWHRPEIFRICLKGLWRLFHYAPERFQIIPFFVISESWAAKEIMKYGWDWICVVNDPLGNKKNMGLQYAMQNFQFDYIMEIGSDDLITNEYMDLIEPELRAGTPLFNISDVWFIDTKTGGTAYYNTEKVIGLGRFIKRTALKPIPRLELWNPEGVRGMDTFSWRHLQKYGIENKIIKTEGYYTLDIKSKININPIDPYTPTPHISAAELCSHFPEGDEILKLIKPV